ncbi:GLOBIN domain-containing protein [Aphelenchoides besseyi]|nr:GLOBIN domain-containing protein [Aphelenchoides besseyi]
MYRNEFNSALLILTAESADNRKEMSNLSQGLGMIEEATTKLAKMSVRADSGIGSIERTNSESTTDQTNDELENHELSDQESDNSMNAKELTIEVEKMHEQIGRLTLAQRELCRQSYVQIQKHSVRFGMTVMLRLFSDHPSYKDIWPQFREVPDSSLMNAEALRKHAAVYTCGIRKVISSMSDDVELEKALRRIAHAHVERNIHKRHLMSMLPCFLKAFEEYKTLDEQSREAWTTLFDVIANLIDIFRV